MVPYYAVEGSIWRKSEHCGHTQRDVRSTAYQGK